MGSKAKRGGSENCRLKKVKWADANFLATKGKVYFEVAVPLRLLATSESEHHFLDEP